MPMARPIPVLFPSEVPMAVPKHILRAIPSVFYYRCIGHTGLCAGLPMGPKEVIKKCLDLFHALFLPFGFPVAQLDQSGNGSRKA